jgi:hypothetical protein
MKLYGLLEVHQQWELHAYYVPSKKDLSKEQLLIHRVQIDVDSKRSSLPQKAGKHFTLMYDEVTREAIAVDLPRNKRNIDGLTKFVPKLDQIINERMKQVAQFRGQRKTTNTKVRIMPIARPEPDIDKMARVLAEYIVRGTPPTS